MEEYVKKLGWNVIKRNNYDGGIDIRAIKEFKDGTIKKLLVQCKHWKTPIPPNEMRAFKTAGDEEHSNYKKVKMFITSSRFSPSAKELANKHDIIMVDGDNLILRKESNGS